ncbi:MAG: ribosome silencing factor [Paludibacteraceae bacterium]|nr:ribosome silencing factor [Paludibacteraceae bacterium]MBP6284535.1 ribosome silencing factor [Paludibacteraceae bacterium]
MTKKNTLLDTIVAGIQEKKGSKIVVADLTKLSNSICEYFVICEGSSNTQVDAIAGAVKEYVKQHAEERPIAIEGLENCQWVVMDYGNIMVHIMQREAREFYDLENLWDDAKLTDIADV